LCNSKDYIDSIEKEKKNLITKYFLNIVKVYEGKILSSEIIGAINKLPLSEICEMTNSYEQ
jgi:hypothetical protein